MKSNVSEATELPMMSDGTKSLGGRIGPTRSWVGIVVGVAIVVGMLMGGLSGIGTMLPSAVSPVHSGFASGGAALSGHPGSAGLSVASQPYGKCGANIWCAPVTASAHFFSSTQLALPALATRPCSVALTAGVCKAPASFTGSGTTYVQPQVNASNDVAMNVTSSGEIAMVYTTYTTSAPTGSPVCAPARPSSLSELQFSDSTNSGTTWTTPILIGTPDCAGAAKYPSAWDPAITSLSNGTLVLAYVQYNSTAPVIPPMLNASSPPTSRLVVSESYTGGSTWTSPTVVNVSKPDPSLTVSFAPVRPSITAYGKTIYLTWMNLGSIVAPIVVSHVAMVVSTTGGKSWSPTITLGSSSSFSANPNVLVQPTTGELFVSYVTGVSYCGYSVGCSAFGSAGTPYSGTVVVASSTFNGTSFSTVTVASGVRLNRTFGPFYNPAPQLAWGSTYGRLDVAFVAGVVTTGAVNGFPFAGAAITPDLFFYSSSTLGASFISGNLVSQKAIINPAYLWGGLPNSTQILDIGVTAKFASNLGLEATVFNGSACVSGYCGAEVTQVLNTSNNGTKWSQPWMLTGSIATNGSSGGWKAFLTGEYESTVMVAGSFLYAWDSASCPSWNGKAGSLGQCGSFSGLGGTPTWTQWGTSTVELSTLASGAGVSETFSAVQSVPANDTWGLELMGGYYQSNGSANITITNIPLGIPILFNGTAPGLWEGSAIYQGGVASVATPFTFSSAGTPLVTITFTELVPLTVSLTPLWLSGHNCQVTYDGYCPLYTPPPGPSPAELNPYACYITTCSNPPPGATSNIAANLGCTSYIYSYVSGDEAIYEFLGNGCINAFVQGTVGSSTSAGPQSNITYGLKTWLPVGKPYTLSPAYWSPLDTMCDVGLSTPIPPNLMTYSFWILEDICDYNYFLELTPQAWLGNGSGSVTSTSTTITVTPTGAVNESIDWNISGWCSGQYGEGIEEGSYSTITYSYGGNGTVCQSGNPFVTSGGGGGGVPVPLSVNETGLPKGTPWGVQLSSGTSIVNKTTKNPLMSFSLSSGSTYNINVLTIPIPGTGQYWVGHTNATVTMPDFNGITVTFVKQTLTGYTFTASVRESGLPEGTGWSLSLTNKATSLTTVTTFPPGPGASVPLTVPLAGGVTYGLNGSSISTSNGTLYYVSSVNVTVDSINSTQSALPPWKQSLIATGPATVNITYSPAYYVTVAAATGGTVSGASQYVPLGKSVNLTAVKNTGYLFVGWVGTGSGSVTSKSVTILVKPSGGAVSEFAVFRPIAAPTWTLDIQASGVPAGQNYSVTIDGVTYSGVGTFPVTNISSGNHLFSAPMAYSTPTVNTRYVASGIATSFGTASGPVFVGANGTVTVTFTPEYLLTIATTTGGSVSGASNGAWLSPGAIESLTATPIANYHFVSWNGTGVGSTSGTSASISVTANGPITELAQFVVNPVPPTPHYQVSVTETGLPASASWNATLGIEGQSGTNSTLVLTGLTNATYTLSVPTVYGSAGVRYVPNGVSVYSVPESVNGADVSATVTFATQYLLTVEVSGNGTVAPSTGWMAAGASVSLTATPNATLPGETPWQFANWTSPTPGVASESTVSYTGLTMNGPVTLTATFVPHYTQKTTTLALQGAPVAFGLLALLLVVGLIAAYVVSRRRGSMSGPSRPSEPAYEAQPAKAEEMGTSDDAMASGGDQAEWAEPPPPPADMNEDGMSD